MRRYFLIALRELQTGGFEGNIGGPGISRSGVMYWFETEPEAHSFVENLNLSYSEVKELANWRKARFEGRTRASFASFAQTAAAK
jgi:hypothetical protein